MANPIIPVTEPVAGIVTRVSLAWVYQDNRKTDKRVVDGQGRPVARVRAFARVFGSAQEVTIEVADQVAEAIEPEQAILAVGSLSAAVRGADYGAVDMTVFGADDLKIVSSAKQVFDSLAKAPGKES